MRNKLIVLCMCAAALALMACGSSGGDDAAAPKTLGGPCELGLCNPGLVCNTKNICEKEATPADGDESAECSGSCSGTPLTKCINDSTDLCVCSTTWTSMTCSSYCEKLGKVSTGCGMDTGRKMNYCLCEAKPADGDPEVVETEIETPVVDGDPEVIVDGDAEVVRPEEIGTRCELKVSATVTLNTGVAACPTGTVCGGFYMNGLGQGQTAADAMACQDDSECWTELGSLAVCSGGFCGMAFCGIEAACSNDTPCAPVSKDACCRKATGAATGQCFPADWCPGNNKPGEACTYKTVNKAAGGCMENVACLGGIFNTGANPATCKAKADCVTNYGMDATYADCVGGYCGMSFCTVAPGSDCNATGGTDGKQGTSTVCDGYAELNPSRWGKACCNVLNDGSKYCFPASQCEQEGTATAGQACKNSRENINIGKQFCTSDLFCLGLGPNPAVTCKTAADCKAPLPTELVDCVDGTCMFSFCTKLKCTGNADCPVADYGTGACCNTTLDKTTPVCGGSYICK